MRVNVYLDYDFVGFRRRIEMDVFLRFLFIKCFRSISRVRLRWSIEYAILSCYTLAAAAAR